jgi:hypothetical protein
MVPDVGGHLPLTLSTLRNEEAWLQDGDPIKRLGQFLHGKPGPASPSSLAGVEGQQSDGGIREALRGQRAVDVSSSLIGSRSWRGGSNSMSM